MTEILWSLSSVWEWELFQFVRWNFHHEWNKIFWLPRRRQLSLLHKKFYLVNDKCLLTCIKTASSLLLIFLMFDGMLSKTLSRRTTKTTHTLSQCLNNKEEKKNSPNMKRKCMIYEYDWSKKIQTENSKWNFFNWIEWPIFN
jgi:hypothetical protein